MAHESAIRLLDSGFRIFGTMDGFALVKWAVKIENPLYFDVYCRLSFDFLDHRGEIVKVSEQWQWFFNVYSQKRHTRMDRGCRYLIPSGSVAKRSGVVKTTSQEANRFAGIDVRIDRIAQIQQLVSDKAICYKI